VVSQLGDEIVGMLHGQGVLIAGVIPRELMGLGRQSVHAHVLGGPYGKLFLTIAVANASRFRSSLCFRCPQDEQNQPCEISSLLKISTVAVWPHLHFRATSSALRCSP